MTQAELARRANVSRPDVCNYLAGRMNYVTAEKQDRIKLVLNTTDGDSTMSKKDILLMRLQRGEVIDLFRALDFGLSALSQRIGDLKREGYPIKNLNEGTNKPGKYMMEVK